jgi:hypothetical protein
MPPKKYNNEDERKAVRRAQQQERRNLQRAEALVNCCSFEDRLKKVTG